MTRRPALAVTAALLTVATLTSCSTSSDTTDAYSSLTAQADVFDTRVRQAPAISYQLTDTDTDGTTTSTGWWIPATGATQTVTTGDTGTSYAVCTPGTPGDTNADGFVQPGACYLKAYNAVDDTATGWYAASGDRGQRVTTPYFLPLSGSLAGDSDPGTGQLPDGATATTAPAGGTYTVTTADSSTRTYTITPTTATITLDSPDAGQRLLTITLDTTAPTRIDPASLTTDGGPGDYSQPMTADEATQLATRILTGE